MSIKKFNPGIFNSEVQETFIEEPLIYSESDSQKKCLESYQKGFEDGTEYGLRQQSLLNNNKEYRVMLDTVSIIYEKIMEIAEIEKKYYSDLKQNVPKLTQECFNVLFPLMGHDLGIQNISEFIKKAMDAVSEELSINILLSKDDELDIAELFKDRSSRLLFEFQENIPSGDCHMTWKGGGGFWQQSEVLAKMSHFLKEQK